MMLAVCLSRSCSYYFHWWWSLLLLLLLDSLVVEVASFAINEVPQQSSSAAVLPSHYSSSRDVRKIRNVLWVSRNDGESDNNCITAIVDDDVVVNFVLEPFLTEQRTQTLFAWISCAIDEQVEDTRYDDFGLAIEAIFGRLSMPSPIQIAKNENDSSLIVEKCCMLTMLKEQAMNRQQRHSTTNNQNPKCSFSLSQKKREMNSLRPLGAGQWSGQYPDKFPHSILIIDQQQHQNASVITSTTRGAVVTSVEDWISRLPRTCRQTIRKAKSSILINHNLTCETKVITQTSPHATIDHFRCILEHEIRIATSNSDEDSEAHDGICFEYFQSFFDAVMEAMERYIISIQGCGTILEYRRRSLQENGTTDSDDHQAVIAFCHMVGKGRTLRGQWFYASNSATKYLLWFHSIWYLVSYAFSSSKTNDNCRHSASITAIDLGPNGSDGRFDAHAILKAKYGFQLYEDWPDIADYRDDFWTIE